MDKDFVIQMVDLKSQYLRLKNEINSAVEEVFHNGKFIKGPNVKEFEVELASFLSCKSVISCANGTDALQIAMMALNLKPGDEVIVAAFTYVATAEVIGLLGLKPVMVDVNPETFNIDHNILEEALSDKTKLIVPVHLFGQCADMESILQFSEKHGLYVIEDAAQAIGSEYKFSSGESRFAGCMGNIGTTSFFPSKNLGCFGDGGAIFTNEDNLSEAVRMIANHGQKVQYTHDLIGVNSRLDELQAAILRIKLRELNDFNSRRAEVANFYDKSLANISHLQVPVRSVSSTHVFHQYTLKVKGGYRNLLRKFLNERNIPSMIYYPIPLHEQNAFKKISKVIGNLENSTNLCQEVLSLPIHTEMSQEELEFIVSNINDFFHGK